MGGARTRFPPTPTRAPLPLVALLTLLLLLVPASALTVEYFSDAGCSAPAAAPGAGANATRTVVWLGLCRAGLAVADCWSLPAGEYSRAYNQSLAVPRSWGVLEEFADGLCPAQQLGAGGAVVTAASRALRAYLVADDDCLRVAELALFVRAVAGGACSLRAAPAPAPSVADLVAAGYVNYTTAVVTDALGTAPLLGFYRDAACASEANAWSYVAGFCMAGLMTLDFGSDATGSSWAVLTAVGPNLCPPMLTDEPTFPTGGWSLAVTTDACTFSPGLAAASAGAVSYAKLISLDAGTGARPLLLGQYRTPASANCSDTSQSYTLPFISGSSCQYSYNDYWLPGASSAIMQSTIIAGTTHFTVSYYSSETNCSMAVKSASFINLALGVCSGPTTGVVAFNANGFGRSLVVIEAQPWLSGPAAEYAALVLAGAPPGPLSAGSSPAAQAASPVGAAVGGAVGALALLLVLAAAATARRRGHRGARMTLRSVSVAGGGENKVSTQFPFALDSGFSAIEWTELEPDLDFAPIFGGFGVVLRAQWRGGRRVAVKVPLFALKYGELPVSASAALLAEARGLVLAQDRGANDHVVRLLGVVTGRVLNARWDAVLARARALSIAKESGAVGGGMTAVGSAGGGGSIGGGGGRSSSSGGSGSPASTVLSATAANSPAASAPLAAAAAAAAAAAEAADTSFPALIVPAQASGRRLDGLVTQWEEGSLAQALYPAPPATPWPSSADDRLRVCTEVVTGLWHLHHVGLVHGDLKPENVLLGVTGHVRLADFGLAQARAVAAAAGGGAGGGDHRLSTVQTTDEKRGTWLYMAPEMFRHVAGAGAAESSAAAAASRSTDVFAFGTLAWEVLAGRAPWAGHSEFSRLAALLHGETLDWQRLPLATPPAVRALLERCLSPARGARPHATELRSTFERELLIAQDGAFDVFLSHAWGAGGRRKPLTDALYAALRAEGLKVWLDSEEMGADLAASMRAGVARSAAFVVLASPDYAASAACMFELRNAAAAGKPVVTCVVEPGFWRTWGLGGGGGGGGGDAAGAAGASGASGASGVAGVRSVPDDHELARLAGLATRLYIDLGEASRVDWVHAAGGAVAEADAATLQRPEALPRLLQQLRDVLPAQALVRSASLRRLSAHRPAGGAL